MTEISKERLTKISNYTMERMLNTYTDLQIKFFFLVMNKAISGHYARARDGENYRDIISGEDIIIEIPTKFIREYSSGGLWINKTDEKHPNSMESIFDELCNIGIKYRYDKKITSIPAFKRAQYDIDRASFVVVINEYILKYVALIEDNYSKVDLEILKQLHGRYEIGLYFIYCKYSKFRKGKRQAFDIDTVAEITGSNARNKNIIDGINKATVKLNSILNTNNDTKDEIYVYVEPTKYNKKITGMSVEFK